MERTGLRVELENDANAAAYGEFKIGAGRGSRNLFYITIGEGIGGAIIIDGKLWTGASGFAGEVGHITVSLVPAEQNRARLSIRSTLDPARIPEALYLRYARVLEGLARQLRSTLSRDDKAGLYEIEFAGLGLDDGAVASPRGQENITPSKL